MTGRAEILAERLAAVRERTEALLAPLADDALARTPDAVMSPPVWDMGHIAAYEERWIGGRAGRRESRFPELSAAYDAFETPRAARDGLPLLDPAACRRYLADVRAETLDLLARADLDPDGDPLLADGLVFEMVAQHEAQHCETILQTLQLLPAGAYSTAGRAPLPATPGTLDTEPVRVPAGRFTMGAGRSGFAYDCERPAHVRELAAFRIGRAPVTNGEHLEFIADGGYRRGELWTEEGWRWRETNGVTAPAYWEPAGDGWRERRFDRVGPPDPARPLCHVSWFEADAHARWAGARLPTEAEWERAAIAAAESRAPYPWGATEVDGRANLGQIAFDTAPVGAFPAGAAPSGCHQLIGDVWEWTATEFDGYPGFVPFPYPEYAAVFHRRGHRVLRGGSWATQAVAARVTFRNWDLPQRRQIFAGLRLAWDEPGAGA